ncbi:MAG: NAD+ synthase [Nitrososphaerales archaeon]
MLLTDLLKKIVGMNYGSVRKKIVLFLRRELKTSGKDGYTFGLSGGLDSAVVAALATEAIRDKVTGLIMPNYKITPATDVSDAVGLAEQLKIRFNVIDVTDIHSNMLAKLPTNKTASGNLLARIRMCLLYYHANQSNSLVIGTSDKSELLIGYFTKYGDGAADMLPIASLYKTQVRALGNYLKLPNTILTKKSSPMLWEHHIATDELGMSYEEIDSILYCLIDHKLTVKATTKKLGIEFSKVAKISDMSARSMHKRSLPKICKL